MSRNQRRLADTLATLAYALTGKSSQVTEHTLNELVEGCEFYLPDGGYSRIVVSELTGNARLTSNSREAVRIAWERCRELVSDLEQRTRAVRQEITQGSLHDV